MAASLCASGDSPAADAGYARCMSQPQSDADAEEAKLAVRVTADRILCGTQKDTDRRTKAGILIPATAKSADRRGVWALSLIHI